MGAFVVLMKGFGRLHSLNANFNFFPNFPEQETKQESTPPHWARSQTLISLISHVQYRVTALIQTQLLQSHNTVSTRFQPHDFHFKPCQGRKEKQRKENHLVVYFPDHESVCFVCFGKKDGAQHNFWHQLALLSLTLKLSRAGNLSLFYSPPKRMGWLSKDFSTPALWIILILIPVTQLVSRRVVQQSICSWVHVCHTIHLLY